jgi:Glycosyl hydrolase family 20, domain 2/Glycosyl hydrolase family 20, catalytic domain
MKRREFLLVSTAALLAARMAGKSYPDRLQTATDTLPDESKIFPFPSAVSMKEGHFIISEDVVIVVPLDPAADELLVARSLRDEFADWFGLTLNIKRDSAVPRKGRVIVMGMSGRSLVRMALVMAGVSAKSNNIPESYSLHVRPNIVVVAGADSLGVSHGLQSLRQLLSSDNGALGLPCLDVQDQPQKPFRGLKLYLPGQQNIAFFKRFIRDFVAAHKYNTLIMELNAGMRLESHPELNAGWREMVLDTNYSRRNYPPGSLHGREQNSCHQDTADGGFIEKQELAEIADFIRLQGIELIPELPSFTHSYYLLTRHKELSEVPGDKWPDTYCPSNPGSYNLLLEVYDEYLDLLKPGILHVGHDELFAPVGLCPRCGDRDIGERYGEDISRIHSHLRNKNIGMAMWGDMLLESVRGKGLQDKRARDGWKYKVAGGLTRAQVDRLIPKDILIFNWFWNKAEGDWSEEQAEKNEATLDEMGFRQVYGNFGPAIENYSERSGRRTILGGAPSGWFATSESNFGRTMITDIMGCSNILWHGDVVKGSKLSGLAQGRMADIRSRFRGHLPPSRTEASISPVEISPLFNTAGQEGVIECDLRAIKREKIHMGRVPFQLANSGEKTAIAVAVTSAKPTSLPSSVAGIRIGADFSSLLFLHASAVPAANREPDRLLWDVFDSADVLGWYEVVYEDGYAQTIPIRYGVDIGELTWQSRGADRDYCYGADPLIVSKEGAKRITMFACEWENARPGKAVSEIRLNGTTGFRGADADYTDHYGPIIVDNAIVLAAISMVRSRDSARNG